MAPLPLFVDFFLEKRTHIRSMWFPLYRTFPHCIGHLQSSFDSLEHSESSFRFDHLNKGWHLVAMAGRTEFHDYLPRDHIQALYTWSRKISNELSRWFQILLRFWMLRSEFSVRRKTLLLTDNPVYLPRSYNLRHMLLQWCSGYKRAGMWWPGIFRIPQLQLEWYPSLYLHLCQHSFQAQ